MNRPTLALPAADPAWRAARSILLVRLDNLGDVLMTTPAIAAVRHGNPQARLTLLASPSGAAALEHVPLIDELIVHEAPWTKRPERDAGATPQGAAEERRFIEQLAARRFDAAIIFTVCTQSALPAALMCRLAGIPLRLAHSRENPYGLLSHWVPETDRLEDGMRHEVLRQLALVAAAGFEPADERLHFHYRVDDALRLKLKFEQAGGDPRRPYLVVHPGATAASRRYRAERFGIAAQAVADDSGCQVVFSGGDAEQALVEQARAAMREPGISLAGHLDLGELAALIAGAQVLICNNSAPAHIASALGTPVVVLYALTNPQHTPWKTTSRVLFHDVPCRNCLKSICPEGHHDCLERVEPGMVSGAALQLIGTPPAVPLNPHLPMPHATLQLGQHGGHA